MSSRQLQKLSAVGAAIFGEARHAALEAMAVHVAHPGQRDGDALVAGLRLRATLDAG